MKRKEYYFKNDEFVIENFDRQRIFSSFLPAVAGKKGVPCWAFYLNRGQGMSSFGVQDKNGAILEFFPAYIAYQVVNRIGFRTFIKLNGSVHEIFCVENKHAKRTMYIKKEQFKVEEVNTALKLKVTITYFTIPNDTFAGLIRKIEVTNLNDKEVDFELVDGLSQVFTPQLNHFEFKVMANVLRSYFDVKALDKNIAFYKLRASTGDIEEVNEIHIGNFYVSFTENTLIRPVVDPSIIFKHDKSYSEAIGLRDNDVDSMRNQEQYFYNKVPCGFTCLNVSLKANESKKINTIIGQAHSLDACLDLLNRISNDEYVNLKQIENYQVIESMCQDVTTNTANPLFNEYIKYTYLDNILRGGYPTIFKDEHNHEYVYHLFSRRHGDLERDYNFFHIAAEYYSQGNGNFRDICQNRRSDVYFNKDVKDFNLKYFMNLIQLDGYNPLGVNGSTFTLEKDVDVDTLVSNNFEDTKDIMKKTILKPFTPGIIVNTVENNGIKAKVSEEKYLANILSYAKQNIEANFGEGFWVDHFTYVLDIYESFNSVYPDMEEESLFGNNDYNYFESPCHVRPRSEKTVLTPQNKVRQYGALLHPDKEKIANFNLSEGTNWAKDKNGEIIKTNLFTKFFSLGFLKFSLLDHHGIGIEMEAGKPGWNDAMNGLPGIFSSGLSETFETLRIVKFLKECVKKYPHKEMLLVKELHDFILKVKSYLRQDLNDFDYWDKVSTAREEYRQILRSGVSGNTSIYLSEVNALLKMMENKLQKAILKAKELGNGIYPTFITYEATKYEKIMINGQVKRGYKDYPLVKVYEFKLRLLPNFLEAPARSLKVINNKKELASMHAQIKETDLYDEPLKMYKTSGSLDKETIEIGRIKSFTKGWFERESNFMHMTYKYLYGLLKAGLYREFFKESKTNLVYNMDPKTYGRNPLEHSSFIATTNNPDPEVRGLGFVARLSGSTAEMLSIYLEMLVGSKLFVLEDGQLTLNLKPVLPLEFFKDNKLSFTLLSNTKVTYVNNKNQSIYGGHVTSFELKKGNEIISVDKVSGKNAILLRDGYFDEVIAHLN